MESILLPVLVFAPLAAALFIALPWFSNNETTLRRFAVGFSGLLFAGSLLLLRGFDTHTAGYQLVSTIGLPGIQYWVAPLGISFTLAIDGISLVLVLLTTFLVFLSLVAGKKSITHKHKFYYSMILVLTSAVLGVFTAKDLFVFFLFWELELLPMFFLISIWGSGRKEYSAMKFVLFTFCGSLFMLASILALYFYNYSQAGILTFDMATLIHRSYALPVQFGLLVFAGFFIGFAVKLPVVPLHTWLPDAHVDAPTPVSMLLAGILLKMGSYGLIRMNVQMLPDAMAQLAPIVVTLGVINIIYAALIALVQKDLKKLVAYSSVSHMGIVLIGLGALNSAGISGAVFQMVAHGIVSAGLFMVVGVIYVRTHTREISELGGLAQSIPGLYHLTMVIALASLGLPLLIGFAAESLVFYGAFTATPFAVPFALTIQQLTVIAAIGIVLTAAYLLWMMQRVFFGPMDKKWEGIGNIGGHEVVVLGLLIAVIVFFGFFPDILSALYTASVAGIAG